MPALASRQRAPDECCGLARAWQVGGNVLINLGTNVVKMGHNQDEETARLGASGSSPRGCLLRSGGWTLFVLGSMMNFVSL